MKCKIFSFFIHYEPSTRQYLSLICLSLLQVLLRAKSSRVDRPLSMSILSHPSPSVQHMLTCFSNSESALNQMLNLSSNSVKTESSVNSSSTIEESQESSQFCEKSQTSSLKRHRKKHRKLRKSGSGSADNLSSAKTVGRSPYHVNSTFTVTQPQLSKSESFSGKFQRSFI